MQHVVKPTTYYRTIGTHPAVLRVACGDQVTMHCVDAHGIDGTDTQVTTPGNPMTGPIAVESLVVGDVLAVTLVALTPLRTHGWVNHIACK